MYGSVRHINHRDKYGTVHRIEFQRLGYSGSSVPIKATAQGFLFEHDEFLKDGDSTLKIYENVIQKGTLDIYPIIQNANDFQLLENIFESDEDEYRIVWFIDNQRFWTGSVLNDLIEYPEMPYPFDATVTAKDFSRLEGSNFTQTTGRQPLIKIIAGILNKLGYDLNIETATSWVESSGDSTKDFLQYVEADRTALQRFGARGEENEAISNYEALERLLSDNALLLKQAGDLFRIEQISAYENAQSVLITTYDPQGNQISAGTEDRTTQSGNIIVKGTQSRTRGYPAIKKARVRFDHRTTVSNLQFPDRITLTENDPIYPDSQIITSTGNTRINFGATNIQAEFLDNTITEASMEVVLSAMGLYWNDDMGDWQSTFYSNTIEMILYATGQLLTAFYFPTTALPIGSGQLNIMLCNATSGQTQAYSTTIQSIHFDIDDPSVPEGTTTAIDYALTQPQGFSTNYEHPATWFGDGPVGYARSALSRDSQGNDLTLGNWGRRGGPYDRVFHENLLKEIMDVQRSWTGKLEAALYGVYDPSRILIYDGNGYFYTGGRFDGYNGDWSISLMRITVDL